MSLRDDLAVILARDARYSVHAYAFIFEALEHTKAGKKQAKTRSRRKKQGTPEPSQHVSGQELCHGARELALRLYGLMALTVLARGGSIRPRTWGILFTI